MIIDFYNIVIFSVFTILTTLAIIIGVERKKSIYTLICLIIYVLLLVLHIIGMSIHLNVGILNILVDFIGIVVSIVSYILINEVESRREKISEVFENRYN